MQDVVLDPGRSPVRRFSSVTDIHTVGRPAATTVSLPPTSPRCATDAAGDPADDAKVTQMVVAGESTKLDRYCVNEMGYPMSASTDQGSLTMDAYGWVTFAPDPSLRGSASVSVRATNPTTGVRSDPTTIEVTVVGPPEARPDAYLVRPGILLDAHPGLLENDVVPATGGWMIQQGLTPPAHGTLDLDTVTGQFTYRPDSGFAGTDSFRYRLSGPAGVVSESTTVTFTVRAD
ncbi:Ig-like domain-containing protein [Herbiconiux liangxiaofengii]